MKKRTIVVRVLTSTGKGPIFRRNPDGTPDYRHGQPLSAQDVNRLGSGKRDLLLRTGFLSDEAAELELG